MGLVGVSDPRLGSGQAQLFRLGRYPIPLGAPFSLLLQSHCQIHQTPHRSRGIRETAFGIATSKQHDLSDHAVLSVNLSTLVRSNMARFGLAWDSTLEIREGQYAALPQGRALTVFSLLSSNVELNQPTTQKHLTTLAACTANESTQQAILSITLEETSKKRISTFDLLAKHPQLQPVPNLPQPPPTAPHPAILHLFVATAVAPHLYPNLQRSLLTLTLQPVTPRPWHRINIPF